MAVYVFTVNGVVTALQPGWSITETANGRNRMDFTVLSLNGSVRIVNDDAVAMTEDGTVIFAGLVDRPSESGFGGSTASLAIAQRIGAVDYGVYPSKDSLIQDIPSGSLKAAMTVVATALSAFGVTLDAAQVTGPTLPALSYNNRPIVDVLNEICSLASGTGSTSYVWEIDYTKTLRAFDSNSLAAPFNITDGDGNVLGDITVEEPRSADYGNYIRLYGGSGLKDETDTFTGNGATTTFALNYTLNSSAGYVTVNGVFETLGAGGTWTYDALTNSITRSSAPAIGATIVIAYVAAFPRVVISDGGAPAALRDVNVYFLADVFDATVLQALADSYLTRDMASPKTVRYLAAYSKTGLHPGQVQTIASTKRNLSGSHLLTEVRIQHLTGQVVQRQVTAVSTLRLPATLREKYQQAFGSGGVGSSSATAVTVVTGGTYLSSPVSLGGSDSLFRAADVWTRVPNALKYVALSTMSVRMRGSIAAHQAVNVTLRLYDETAGAAAFTGAAAAATVPPVAPADYTTTGLIIAGHVYHLEMLSGTSGVPITGIGHLESL
jgi:hypothetical protein